MSIISERLLNKITETLDLLKSYAFSNWKGLDLNYSEALILSIISESERIKCPIHKSQIAKRLNITKAAVTQFCNKLEKKGYISSYTTEDNKKNHYLQLDNNLRKSIESRCETMNNNLNKFIEKVGEENIELFMDLLGEFDKTLLNV